MQALPSTRSCFVCGQSNASGLKLSMETDGERVFAQWRPAPDHAGFTDTVHGGLISTVLDELMVWVCAVKTRRFAYCAELSVRFLQPVRPGQSLQGSAHLAANRRGRIFEAHAEMRDEAGALLAKAMGKYLPVAPAQAREMLSDLIGSAETYLDLEGSPGSSPMGDA